jgi:glycosyltransferase involved in cell wall biosynthesis
MGPYFLFIGNQMKHKNLKGLLLGFKLFLSGIISTSDPIPCLIIVGASGSASADIRNYIKQLGISKYVQLLGYVADEDLAPLYTGAEDFLFPSLMEGFGLPILEAQSCETPVLCSNTSSLPEVGGDSVLYFDPTDRKDIAMVIQAVYCDPSISSELRGKGLANVGRFSWQDTARKMLNLIDSTLR